MGARGNKWGNPNPRNNGSDNGPLRKLEYITIPNLAGGDDMWLLECGHKITVATSTMYRARCWRCKRAAQEAEEEA